MSAPPIKFHGGFLLRRLGNPVRTAYLGSVALFLGCVAQFFHDDTGFSSLISIGDQFADSQVTALRQSPHYVYEGSPGYDGAYYVQLALYPTLGNPELKKAIDNLPYRAKRILFCWTAWALGLGQPAWIVQAHALLNVLCWLLLGWALLRWFPPTGWENFLRWAAVMFSHGVCMSVRHSLVDAPSLLLVALALRWLEDGRRGLGATTLALAGLGKETSLLAAAGLDFDWRAPRTWGHTARTVALIALPLAAWMLFIRWKFGPADDPGLGNFTLPFAGYVEKWRAAWSAALGRDTTALHWATFAVVIALGAQWLFFIVRRRPGERWWRVGFAFAVMMTFLWTPVWEGYPGASTRVLLPMTLAFNVLVPRGRRWLALLAIGNLTVVASGFEFSPPHEFYEVRGESSLRAAVQVKPAGGWHNPERHLDQHWRWSSGRAEVRVTNRSGAALRVTLHGQVSSAEGMRTVRVSLGEKMVWSDTVSLGRTEMRFGLALPPGETVLAFTSDTPAQKVGTDPRDLAFQVANLEIVLQPAPVPR
ncbi:MAG: hypothetical protein EXS37_16855 [Opitutus sp.]|nr:hypothetical protein [Opitutus sp.]